MKKVPILVLAILLAVSVFSTIAMAAPKGEKPLIEITTVTETEEIEAASDLGILPDSPFYFLKRFLESLQLALTFNSETKAEKLMELAELRLSELAALPGEKQAEFVSTLTEAFEEAMEEAEELLEEELEEDEPEKELVYSGRIDTLQQEAGNVADAEDDLEEIEEAFDAELDIFFEEIENSLENLEEALEEVSESIEDDEDKDDEDKDDEDKDDEDKDDEEDGEDDDRDEEKIEGEDEE